MFKKIFEFFKRKIIVMVSRTKNQPKDKKENKNKERGDDIYPLWWFENAIWVDLFHSL